MSKREHCFINSLYVIRYSHIHDDQKEKNAGNCYHLVIVIMFLYARCDSIKRQHYTYITFLHANTGKKIRSQTPVYEKKTGCSWGFCILTQKSSGRKFRRNILIINSTSSLRFSLLREKHFFWGKTTNRSFVRYL